MTTFRDFADELNRHNAPGYHRCAGPLSRSVVLGWFAARAWAPPDDYVDFLVTLGPGRYFDGYLELFPLGDGAGVSVERLTRQLEERGVSAAIAIGSAGVTEGCYCVPNKASDGRLLWYSWETGSIELEAPSFRDWIEAQPAALFNEKSYAGFRPIRDMQSVLRVIEERKAFSVRIVSCDKDLIRSPGHEADMLPRYHRIVLGVTKRRGVDLGKVTVELLREGSEVGSDNVCYHTLDVSGIPLGIEVRVEIYAFDPLNLPFRREVCLYTGDIAIGSPMRTNYPEIVPFL